MEQYNIEKLKKELKKLKDKKMTGIEKMEIAMAEMCSVVTVDTYLKGDITVPALADAILKRGNFIVKNRKK